MKIIDSRGRKWRLGRRILPWRTRASWVPALLYVGLGMLLSEAFLIGLAVLLLVIPFALLLLLGWLTAVLLSPLYMLGQWIGLWPKLVVAYLLNDQDNPRAEKHRENWRDELFMREKRFQVYSWPFTTGEERQRFIAAAARSLRDYGEPYPESRPTCHVPRKVRR